MAITGSGTADDPYVVHSYSEIKSILDVAGTSGHYSNPHMLLANDINCNDYGAEFVWQTLKSANENYPFTLDLGGFAIKNVAVGSNAYLFFGYGSRVKNGKLLNIYCTGCENLSEAVRYDNVSMSIDASGCSKTVLSFKIGGSAVISDALTNCSIYVQNLRHCFISSSGFSAVLTISNCDILVNTPYDLTQNSDAAGCLAQINTAVNCRFRGEMKGFVTRSIIGGTLDTCVADIHLDPPKPTNKHYCYSSQGVTVYNSDYCGGGESSSAYSHGLDSNKIKNGAELRNVGFPVVNVVGG